MTERSDDDGLLYTRFELFRAFRTRRFFFFSLGFPLVLFFAIAGPNRHVSDFDATGISLRSTTWSASRRSGR